MPFRSSGQLGPGLEQKDASFFWDFQPGVDVSPRLGNPEFGNDGHTYVLVRASANIAAGGAFTINETTWNTASGTGYTVPAGAGAITSGQYFWARRDAL